MDFFKFNPNSSETVLEDGEFINGIEQAMWVERYSMPGEFSFTGLVSSGIGSVLPPGTLISHVGTSEVMIVENQEIQENKDEDPSMTITGRSFVSYLENRIVGTALVRSSSTLAPYVLSADDVWDQIVTMINAHIKTGVASTNDSLDDVSARTLLGSGGESIERTIDRGTVLERVLELLIIEELGIKTVRKGFDGASMEDTFIEVYKGTDVSNVVNFSWLQGDLDSANYLVSLKDYKNSAMVVGQYVAKIVDVGPTKYNRRMMFVDAVDIDGHLAGVPTGGTLTSILNDMNTRGLQAIYNQNTVTISQTDISNTTKYQYRRDYRLGDLVTLDANFNQSLKMRVVEYAEIEDENGESGHPTLAVPLS